MTVPEIELGVLPFVYTGFVEGDHHVIRVITILPLEEGRPDSDPIQCYLDHVHICACHLAPGESGESLISRKPTIFFDRYVRNRPKEVYPIEIAHSTTLYEECFKRPDPESTEDYIKVWEDRRVMKRLTKRVSKLFGRSATREEPSYAKYVDPGFAMKILTEGMARMIEDPEDTGGAFSFVTPTGGRHGNKLPPPSSRPKAKPRSEFHRKYTWDNYIAISYSWGTEISKNKVFLKTSNTLDDASDDDNAFGSISVHRNPEAALRRFRNMRYFKTGGPIWIDALCVNQMDEKEKSQQLQLMSHIYGSAGNILVWLGEGSSDLYVAMDLVRLVGISYRTEWQEALDDSAPRVANAHRKMVAARFKLVHAMWKVAHAGGGPSDPVSDGILNEFFSLAYWRRLWIIQELAMGTVDMAFVLGDRVTEWRYIRDTAFLIDAIRFNFEESLPAISLFSMTISHLASIAQLEIRGHKKVIPRTYDYFQRGTHLNSIPSDGPMKGSPLWQAFQLMAYSQCYNKQDRVFGILALPGLPDGPDLGIVTDVSKTAVEVYKEFIIACMKSWYRDPFGIFCLLEGIREVIDPYESLPSRVPHLASERRTGIIEGHFRAGEKWHASQIMGFVDVNGAPEFLFEDGNLCVYGCVIDAVDGLGAISASSPDIDDPTLIPGLTQVSNMAHWSIEDPPENSIWQCFVAGTDENGTMNPRGYEELLDVFCAKEFMSWESRDIPAQDFIVANAELLINGRPLTSYLKRWTDSLELQQELATFGYHQIFGNWEQVRARMIGARHSMVSRIRNKRLMVTDRGMLGLVPNRVIASDVVLLVQGHGRPLVASRLESKKGENLFCLKGEAFIEGMMAGEMMEDEVVRKWEWLTFI
ncbi:hypothetical protein N0V83_008971 [Neocucurbitaria cava]|uniref:Heterokaryon incompatibility domain-containing protein n=1 Tax=Neocucurbitaria cava TaxID=798079 RepID=A0A9W9CIH6_9PLEO|nr:hypothetical protein N0V83_008971 [Neocucurbitaria cava]